MKDYKHIAHQIQANARSKASKRLPARRGAAPKKKGINLSYRAKYYLVITGLLCGLYFYMHYQVANQTDSAVYQIYKLADARFGPLFDRWSEDKGKLSVKNDQKEEAKKTEVLQPQKKEIEIFLAKTAEDSRSLDIASYKTEIKLGDKHPVGYALDAMIRYRPRSRSWVQGFPEDVRLLDVHLENGVLLLNFNKAFEYNKYGHMGLRLQIQQVLWTSFHYCDANNIPVEAVSFLVNGERKRNIGGEGLALKLFYTKKHLEKSLEAKPQV